MDRDELRRVGRLLLRAKVSGDKTAEDAARAKLAPFIAKRGRVVIKAMKAKAKSATGNDNT